MPDYFILDGDDERAFTVETLDEGWYEVTTPDDETFVVDAYEPETGRIHLLKDGESHDVDIREIDESYEVTLEGLRHKIDVLNERQMRMRKAGVGGAGGGGPELESEIAGNVVEIVAAKDETVEKDETVVIVEAMKMENDIKAHKDGTIDAIHVEAGDSVEVGDTLVSIGD